MLKPFLIAALSLTLIGLNTQVLAKANAKKGQQLAAACVACHGADGNSILPAMPKIAGQNEKYFVEQMLDFKNGEKSGRANPIMQGIVATLSEQDIQDLAAYFAMQKPSVGVAKKEDLQLGAEIYRGGLISKGIPACSACHSPKGKGNAQAGFPLLSGQHAEYIVQQLEAYKNGTRQNDINGIMGTIARKMSKKEIEAVANFIAGLH